MKVLYKAVDNCENCPFYRIEELPRATVWGESFNQRCAHRGLNVNWSTREMEKHAAEVMYKYCDIDKDAYTIQEN